MLIFFPLLHTDNNVTFFTFQHSTTFSDYLYDKDERAQPANFQSSKFFFSARITLTHLIVKATWFQVRWTWWPRSHAYYSVAKMLSQHFRVSVWAAGLRMCVCVCGFVVSERNTGPRASNGTVSAPHTRQPHVVLVSELTCAFLHTVISFLRVHLCTEVTQGYAAKQNECGICCYLWTPHEGTSSQNSVLPRHWPLSYSSFVELLLTTPGCCASLETPPTWHQLRLIFL